MIALDTNVLVRYLVQDDPTQSRRAAELIETRCSVDAPGWVSLVVLCELVWVMEAAYRFNKDSICTMIRRLLHAQDVRVEYAQIAVRALKDFSAGTADYNDYLILHLAEYYGAETLYSFDKRLCRHPWVSAVPV